LPVLLRRAAAAARARARYRLLQIAGVPLGHLCRRLAERSGPGLGVALVYHRVGDPAGDPRRELLPALGSSLFHAHVRHLASHYRLVAASELLDATRTRRPGTRLPVALTFDDDLLSHAEAAAPILESEGTTATFFVSGASLYGPHRFWWERLQAAVDAGLDLGGLGFGSAAASWNVHELGHRIQTLSPDERDDVAARLVDLVGADPVDSGLRLAPLRRLATSGHEIGFHTRRHDLLPPLRGVALRRAMRDGRDELERVLEKPLRTISYPHGEADAHVAAEARAAGFEAGFTGEPSAVTPHSDPLLLGRVSPSYRSVGELAFDVGWTLLRAAFTGTGRARPAHRIPAANPP
jgi:peptidoglycan/xylan/chitin deacetylase (PgdA/CDA1 family)